MDNFDKRVPIPDFKRELTERFGEDSISLRALDQVTATMDKGHGYTRDNGEDYFVHPIAVAKILLDYTTADDKVIAAALLHDCIEDVPECTYGSVEAEYGETVAHYVMLVTKDDDVDYHVYENMRSYMLNICSCIPAIMIKIADRMNNNSTVSHRSAEYKARKTKETQEHFMILIETALPTDVQNREFYLIAKEFFEKDVE